ncbi:MAG: DUF4326 domain-containing protein [Roseibium sp.]|nr:DUF4326 domain-containing protein [Roseibium sp.]
MPKRLQLSRKKGWRLPPGAVSVARPTKWGNPFRVGDPYPHGLAGAPMDADTAVTCFEAYAVHALPVHELAGKDLACWCAPGSPCHADVLLRYANGGGAS